MILKSNALFDERSNNKEVTFDFEIECQSNCYLNLSSENRMNNCSESNCIFNHLNKSFKNTEVSHSIHLTKLNMLLDFFLMHLWLWLKYRTNSNITFCYRNHAIAVGTNGSKSAACYEAGTCISGQTASTRYLQWSWTLSKISVNYSGYWPVHS